MDGDTISVLGHTVRNRTVYTFNLNMLDSTLSEFNEHLFIYTISDTPSADEDGNLTGLSPRGRFFLKLKDFIDDVLETNPSDIDTGTSDSYGYFKLGPIRLKYQEINKIVICVYYEDTQTWDFRIRPVLSKWYGGLLVQDSFTQEGTGHLLPNSFSPPAKITGKIIPMLDTAGGVPTHSDVSCSLGSIMHTASNKYTSHVDFDERWSYSYCYKKITMKDTVVSNWARIGNGGMVWVEIEDLNINHIYEWGITSAKMVIIDEPEDPEEVVVCDEDTLETTTMESVEIETFVSGQRSVPPSVCILKPTDGKVKIFFNDEWELQITYWYKKLSNDIETSTSETMDVEVLSPDFEDSSISFDESTLDITIDQNNFTFTVESVYNQTVALMAQFVDEDSRIVACMNTKMLTQVVKTYCRNVEILYRYEAPASSYVLKPETSTSSFAVPPFKEVMTGSHSPHISWPACGDHKNGLGGLGKGYLWYPFSACDEKDFYREFSSAASCTAYFAKGGADLRYQAPIEYHAWVTGGGGGAYSPCVLDFHYYYSRITGDTIFTGKANMVSYVDWAEYAVMGWTMPTFGNKGREAVIKFLSQDRWSHLSYKNTIRPTTRSQWVPIVPDTADFFMSFNAFDEASSVSPDEFSHINQFGFLTSTLINEQVEVERKRFDEVFGLRGIWRATYPPPLVTVGTIQKTLHFYFKDSDIAWAWQERGKDIEYVDRNFFFATYEKPEYKFSYEKEEHRYICDEGLQTITYTAPVVEDGVMIKYPSLQLGNGPKRFFKILYDTYSGDVEWADEGSGNVDGSVDEGDEPNIYEVTSPTPVASKWDHDENCLFDSEAVRTYTLAEAADRKFDFVNAEDEIESSYYNRGVIVNISRNILNFLPYEGIDMQFAPGIPDEPQATSTPPVATTYGVWHDASPTIIHSLDFSEAESGSCIYKVIIKGQWGITDSTIDGVTTKYRACLPGIEITGVSDDGSDVLWTKTEISFDEDIYGNIGIRDFEFEFFLQPTVDRMLNSQESQLKVKLICVDDQYLLIDSIRLVAASYCDLTEQIIVYEQKYLVSKADNFGDHNINGPKVGDSFVLQHELELDNSGTYYAISPSTSLDYVPTGSITARDKIRGVYAQEQHYGTESIQIDTSTISKVEQEEQKSVYTTAYYADVDGDTTNYSIVCHPALEEFLSEYGIPNNVAGGTFVSTTKKTPWSYYESVYTPGSVWHPVGHKWQWGPDITRMTCWEYAYGSTAFVLQRYDIGHVLYMHLDLGGGVEPLDPLSSLYAERMQYQIDLATKLGLEVEDTSRIMGTAKSFIDTPTIV